MTPSQRIVEAAARLPAYAAIGGWAAAYWRGVRFLDGRFGDREYPVLLNLGAGTGHIRPLPHATLLRTRLAGDDVALIRGIPMTVPVRTAFDGARLAGSLPEAVIFLDIMCASGLITPDALARYVSQHADGWRGVKQARRALDLVSSDSRSPQETRLRLLWVLASELGSAQVNHPVLGLDGALLGIPDLLDECAGVVGEYDGSQHRALAHHTADNVREERLEDAGLIVVRVTALDLTRPRLVVERLNRAYRRGVAQSGARRRWVVA